MQLPASNTGAVVPINKDKTFRDVQNETVKHAEQVEHALSSRLEKQIIIALAVKNDPPVV